MIIHYKKDGSASKALFEQGKFLYEKPVISDLQERTFWDKP